MKPKGFSVPVCGCGSVCQHARVCVCVCLRVGGACVFLGTGGLQTAEWGHFPEPQRPPWGARLHWFLTSCSRPHYSQIKTTPWGPVTPELLRDHTSVLRKWWAMWAPLSFTVTCHRGCREMTDNSHFFGILGGRAGVWRGHGPAGSLGGSGV